MYLHVGPISYQCFGKFSYNNIKVSLICLYRTYSSQEKSVAIKDGLEERRRVKGIDRTKTMELPERKEG